MHFLSAQSNAFDGKSEAKVKNKILEGYKAKIENYPDLINEIIQKLVKLDPNERADYQEIAKYPEIRKHFKNIAGITEEEKL